MATTVTGFVPTAVWRRRTIALFIILLAMFMDLLDVSVVNVALPPIQRDLNTSFEAVQWVLSGYTLAFAVLLITAGRLGDILGHKRMFMIGAAGFTVASVLCGASQNGAQLIAWRVLQGAMAALMVPQVLSILQSMYAPCDRGRAMGAFAAVAGVATVGGPVLGVVLTSGDLFGLGWRAVFYVNVPVGIGALIVAALFVPMSKSPHPLRVDVVGVLLSTASLFLIVCPLVQGREKGWPGWIFAMLAGGLVVLASFAGYQHARTRRDGSPMVDT